MAAFADVEGRRERAERQLGDFFELSLDLLCIAGFDGYFTHINQAFERTLGYTNAELMSRPFIEFVHPDDRARTLEAFHTHELGQDVSEFETRYLCSDGRVRWLQWSARVGTRRGSRVRGGARRHRAAAQRRPADRAAPGCDAGRRGGLAGRDLRRDHRGGRAGAGHRPHQLDPVRPGRRGHGRWRVDQHRPGPTRSRRQPVVPRRAEHGHCGARDRPAGADRRLRRHLGPCCSYRPQVGYPGVGRCADHRRRAGCGAS